MKIKTTLKNTVRINVAINANIYHKVVDFANTKGMKINKVVEFAILDYLTNHNDLQK